MRLQRSSSGIWRYCGICAMLIYLCSFGTFMSRMLTLDQTGIERVTDAVEWHYSTRTLAYKVQSDGFSSTLKQTRTNEAVGVPRSTRESPQSGAKSTLQPVLELQKPPSLNSSAINMKKLGEILRATNKTPIAAAAPQSSEIDDQPEVKLLRMFERQRNASRSKSNPVPQDINSNLTEILHGNFSVLNPHPFTYLINSESLCRNPTAPYLLVYVHTAPDHYKRRMIIRQTWGDGGQYTFSIRVVFFAGSPASVSVQRALQFEAEQYGDIVQEDFLDSYRNLTYKGIAALKWISTYCPDAKFILKTDDDIFVNMFTLQRHLNRLEKQRSGTVNRLLMCLVWYGMPVMRSGKWMVTKEEWKEDSYPTYCSGSAFVMSTDVAVSLHEVSYFVPFFWVDDFYITGLLPQKLGTITHTQFMSTYLLNGKALEEKFTGPQWYKYIFSHVHNLDAIQTVWRKVVALYKGDFIPTIQYLIPNTTAKSPPN